MWLECSWEYRGPTVGYVDRRSMIVFVYNFLRLNGLLWESGNTRKIPNQVSTIVQVMLIV